MRTLTLILTLTILTTQLKSQSYQKQQAELFATNIIFSGFSSGIGACFNKKSNQTFINAFANGFWKGSIGGAVSYIGKRINYQIVKQNNLVYAWPAKVVNSLGCSMAENGAFNRGLLEQVHLYLGFTRLDYNFKYNAFQVRFNPTTIISYYQLVKGDGGKLDINNSLKMGTVLIRHENCAKEYYGLTSSNVIWYTDDDHVKITLAHENIHVFQNEQDDIFNSYFSFQKKVNNKVYRGLENYIYIHNSLASNIMYRITPSHFENEAYSIAEHNLLNCK